MKELATALVKARSEFKPVVKDSTNPHFKSKFASLESCLDATSEALAANGLAVVQFPTETDSGPALRTILLHTSGESLEDTMPLLAQKPDPQGLGSAITYARRYSLMSVLGVAAEDDDGNAASKPAKEPKPEPTVSTDRLADFETLLSKCAQADTDDTHTSEWYRDYARTAAEKAFKKSSYALLTDSEMNKLVVAVQKKLGELAGAEGQGTPAATEEASPASASTFKAPTTPRGAKAA